MNTSAIVIKDLTYEQYLKIVSKLHKPLGKCNFKEFSNIMSGVNPPLLELSYDPSFILFALQCK